MLTRMGKSKQAKVEGTEDRLQNLPDEILTQILSFLSTKESVRTSVLSTRWNSVWASVPTLDLAMIDFCSKEKNFFEDQGGLFDFLNRVLMSGIVHSLQKLDIKAQYPIHSSRNVHPRVCASIERSVVGLQYESDGVSVNRPYEFPQSLFCCKKLVVLKLCVKMVLNFPMASICFPNLKVLALVSIIYKDDYSAQNLFSSCPVLEDLVIVRDIDDNLGTLNVTSGSLKNLVIDVTGSWGRVSGHVRKTLIDASALESLHIDDDATDEYNVVKDFSSMTKATLSVVNNEMNLFELLKKISNVKFLSLSCLTMLHLSAANSFNLPTFENLTCLEIPWNNGFGGFDLEWELLLEFLKRSPVLEVLFFEGWFSWPEEFGMSQWDVPSCVLSHLKTIIIRTDIEESVQLTSYFLKNAKVLEKMTIDCLGDKDLKLLLNEELSMSLRGSVACQCSKCSHVVSISTFTELRRIIMLTRMGKSKQAKVEGTEDRLQNLPDEILTQILSFLSTKESVRTSVLSTRWNSVWASVPTLDLIMKDFCSKEKGFSVDEGELFDFLNRVLMSGGVHSLQKVDIKAWSIHPSWNVQPWVCAAIERSVVGLRYESSGVSVNQPYEFPQSLFCCKKLVVLKLCVQLVLNFPMASICLPNLKVLALVSIIYKDDYSAQNLFSSCPVLEDLVIVREGNDNLGTLNVTSGSLKNLVIDVAWGKVSGHVQKTLIDASALESLHIDDDATDEYNVVKDFSSMTKAKLSVENNEMNLFELLKKISNVKFLSLSCITMSYLSAANSFNLPTFENLTCLEIPWNSFIGSDLELELLLEFLKRSPVLEVLFFERWFSWPEEFEMSQWDVPSCLLSHLKTIIIRTDMEESVQLISYFLNNAKVLEKMTIDCLGDEDVKLLLNEELSKSLRGSIACRVEIL